MAAREGPGPERFDVSAPSLEALRLPIQWPDYPPPRPPPTPPPLPVPVLFKPVDYKDRRVLKKLMAWSLRRARANSLKIAQAHLYTSVPDEYINWKAFELPWVCRVRGCKRYGHNFKKLARLQSHLESPVHQSVTKPVEVSFGEESGNELYIPPRVVRFDPPPPPVPSQSLWDYDPNLIPCYR